jgi:hypothetical protein
LSEVENLAKIRDNIIIKNFPELMDDDIQVEYNNLEDALFEYGELSEEGFYIEVDESLKDAPEEVIEGGLAHELSHILTDKKEHRNLNFRDRLAYKFSLNYRTLDERNTDFLVIIRGYGNQLLTFLKYAEKKGFPHYKEDGLSIREIEALLSTEI